MSRKESSCERECSYWRHPDGPACPHKQNDVNAEELVRPSTAKTGVSYAQGTIAFPCFLATLVFYSDSFEDASSRAAAET
jgi:hypothetical protein